MRTALDMLVHLLDFANEIGGSSQERSCKSAILDALREIGNAHDWSYYRRHGRIATTAPYSTGTIAYDHTGGTSERLITLTGGTFPTAAPHSVIVINNVPYEVDEYKSTTTITLGAQQNPGADVAALTTYSLQRYHYELPETLRALEEVKLSGTSLRCLEYIPPHEWFALFALNPDQTGEPSCYTILGEEDQLGRMALAFYPAPDAAYAVEYLGVHRPGSIVTWKYSDGTVSVTSGADTLTGSGTTWTSRMEGAVIRIASDNTDEPTDLEGANPYALEGRVKAFTSVTAMRLYANADQTLSTKKYVISDPIDLAEGEMFNVFRACARWKLAQDRGWKNQDTLEQIYERTLLRAKESDSRSKDARVAGQPGFSRAGYRALGADVGPD